MISVTDIIVIGLVAFVYLLLMPFQLVLFPMKYYSVKDVIYSRNPKKATGALLTRFVFIFLLCLFLWILKRNIDTAIYGITIGSFLCSWPSIYHYQLYAFFKNKYKALYFLACIVSVLFSWASAVFATKVLLPMIFEEKGFYLIDNNGIQTLINIISLIMPIGMRKVIKNDEQDNPYLVSDTIDADTYLTKRKIDFEHTFFEHYQNEIEEAAQKYGISFSLLNTVLQLEKINRGAQANRIGERLAVKLIPGYLIRKNVTLGLAQVSIKEAKSFFHKAPERYLEEMLKPEISIELCAYILKEIMNQYTEFCCSSDDEPFADLYEDQYISEDYKFSVFTASNYICGDNNTLKKYVLIYADIIYQNSSPIFPENG